jgi:hypothetical protein
MVRSLEIEHAPINNNYFVFLGEYPKKGYLYCPKPECREPSKQGTRLSTVLGEVLSVHGNMNDILNRLKKDCWVLDLFGSEASKPHDEFVRRASLETISESIADLKHLMLEEKNRLPSLVIPAMKHNAHSDYYRKRRPMGFGARVYYLLERDYDLGSLFEPLLLSPWSRDYRTAARSLLAEYGFIAESR